VKGFDLILFACLPKRIENVVVRLEKVAWVRIAMVRSRVLDGAGVVRAWRRRLATLLPKD
jgi:hypothetical protein